MQTTRLTVECKKVYKGTPKEHKRIQVRCGALHMQNVKLPVMKYDPGASRTINVLTKVWADSSACCRFPACLYQINMNQELEHRTWTKNNRRIGKIGMTTNMNRTQLLWNIATVLPILAKHSQRCEQFCKLPLSLFDVIVNMNQEHIVLKIKNTSICPLLPSQRTTLRLL